MATSVELPIHVLIFHARKGILTKPALNTNAQFGLATLWRRAKHKFTPQLVRDILASERFQNRLELWTITHALGSNSKARFEQTKMLRSHEGALTLCYAVRRLANNIEEPFRTLSLQGNRHFNQMVARKTCTTSISLAFTLVPHSEPSTPTEAIPSEVAPPGAIVPSPMPQPVLQNGPHQTCSCTRPTMQPQTSYHRLVQRSRSHMLLQALAEIPGSGSQSIRPTLGF